MKKVNNVHSTLYRRKKHHIDMVLELLVYISAMITIFILSLLIIFILSNGLPYISFDFLTTPYLENDETLKGILPMIINTMYIVVITILIATPIGIATAIYLTQYAKQGKLVKCIRFATEVLAGIPSIIFGLFGYTVFCVLFRLGTSILAGCLTMSMCILPIIIRTAEESLIAVPQSYKEGAIALGAKKIRVIFEIILPCSVSGIFTSFILAIGRIVGESAALLYTSGMAYNMPKCFLSHILSSGRTLTLHLYQSSKQASTPNAFHVAFATAAVLLILFFILDLIAQIIVLVFNRR